MSTSSRPVIDSPDDFKRHFEMLHDNVGKLVHGQPTAITNALVCLFAGGHLLMEGVPGVGKTTLAKAIAYSIGGRMKRIQFTPDLLPSDVVGFHAFNQLDRRMEFSEGPVFSNVVVADEINRASPKTQSALLEVMEERQVTVDSHTRRVDPPFFVVATQNPVEHEGTYRLPEAQLDRFLMKLTVGYPDLDSEIDIIIGHNLSADARHLPQVLDIETVAAMIAYVRKVEVSETVSEYLVGLVAATRLDEHRRVLRLPVSPRGSIGLATAARALAASKGRTFVTADDVRELIEPVLNHRLVFLPAARHDGVDASSFLRDVVDAFPTPRSRGRRSVP